MRVSDGLPAGRALGRGRAGRLGAAGRPTRPPHLAAAGSERVRGPRGPVRGLARARDDGDDAGRAYVALIYHYTFRLRYHRFLRNPFWIQLLNVDLRHSHECSSMLQAASTRGIKQHAQLAPATARFLKLTGPRDQFSQRRSP